jgi:hypothetical protein
MYERRRQPLLSPRLFTQRLLWHFGCALLLLVVSLALGMAGYRHYEHLPWRNAFENSAMLLGGMGPVDNPVSNGGKVFAGVYALYAGLVFIAGSAIMLAPILHRLLHSFHSDERDK